jgi:hypothetical protein
VSGHQVSLWASGPVHPPPDDDTPRVIAECSCGQWREEFPEPAREVEVYGAIDRHLVGARLTWPDDGPAVEYGRGRHPVYRKPTLTNLTSATPGAVIATRADQKVGFCFTEDGKLVTYSGTISQDVLFRLLLGAGLLPYREERP